MSHPIQPQGRRDDTPAAHQSSVSTGNYSAEQNGRGADPTVSLRSPNNDGANNDGANNEGANNDGANIARNRAEFDQDFDDQARLREQTAGAPGSYDRYDAANGTPSNGGLPTPGTNDAALTTSRFAADNQRPLTDDDRTERAMPTTIAPDRETVTAREKERFGGMSFGSGFFGWLTATGMAVLLITLVAAAGVALGIASNDAVGQVVQDSQTDTGTAQTVGLVGGILLLVILFVAYFSGGYVAGRMARFSGAKQGLAVWLWALITTALIAAIAAIAGSQYNVLAQLNLPRIPVDEGSVTTAGIIAIGAAILVALIGAVLGGITGTRFHRKVDAVGFTDDGRI